jgi:magnesium chelatase family protein
LFLDELPEFPRAALEALREPLETGWIRLARAAHRADFPAQFQLIAAMNPCPCGFQGQHNPDLTSSSLRCRCTPEQITRYQNRLSGPLLDRIDLHIAVSAVPLSALWATSPTTGVKPQSETEQVQARVIQARARAMQRQRQPNQALRDEALQQHASLSADTRQLLNAAAQKLGWSARGVHRALRVSRTIADLAGAGDIQAEHLAEAIQYRSSTPF